MGLFAAAGHIGASGRRGVTGGRGEGAGLQGAKKSRGKMKDFAAACFTWTVIYEGRGYWPA